MVRELREAARCAKLIRLDLKTSFPTTKFSIVSDNFSMGDSVRVSWVDGPTQDEVNLLINHYSDGDFDGMTDCYNYRENPTKEPRTKYLHLDRDMSKEMETEICKAIEEPLTDRDYEQDRRVYSKFRATNWVNKQHIETFEEQYERELRCQIVV